MSKGKRYVCSWQTKVNVDTKFALFLNEVADREIKHISDAFEG